MATAASRMRVDVRLGPNDLHEALCRDARAGLAASPKSIPPTWFYDERGSKLYEDITRLPEYYPFRVERDLLRANAVGIAEAAAADVLVELGSGTSEKTYLLLDAMQSASAGLAGYVAFDVSEAPLLVAGEAITRRFGIDVDAVVGDFHTHLDALPTGRGARLVAFLGSTIGNLDRAQRHGFLSDIAALLGPQDSFLLATDLLKPVDRLLAAYDDGAGVTAEFNRNVLNVINQELDATFDPDRFHHVARWNPRQTCVEMWLRATEAMNIEVPALGMNVELAAGEEILTEISTKFTPAQVGHELSEAGMAVTRTWVDPGGDYLLSLARIV